MHPEQKARITYGNKIKSDNKTTQNFSQPENFVVLECVNRLLEKGYRKS
jgi:type I restriction enzyme M protein